MSRPSLLLLLTLLSPLTFANDQQREAHEREEGCLDGRAQEYLRLHNGIIDPEARLYVAREVYESQQRDEFVSGDSIGGSTWTSIGPTNGGGRIGRISLHPTVSGTLLAGASGGGVWRTTNSGVSWTPLTDAIPFLYTGAVAYAPSNPSRIYVGTGEGDVNGIPNGIGLIWSTDGGATWNFPSSVLAAGFYAISVHPTNADEILVGTTSGAFRSTSGPNGPWTEVIKGSSTPAAMAYGAVTDIERDPTNANILYATTHDKGAWCALTTCFDPIRLYAPTVLKSTDGGATWNAAATGIPSPTSTKRYYRFAIAIAPSSPSTLYTATSSYDSSTGATKSHIYKTTDSAGSWSETAMSTDPNAFNYLIQTDFDNAIAVSPSDPNTVVAGGVFYVRTTNGGTSWSSTLNYPVHVDVHDLVFDSAGTLYVANDGGFYVSSDGGITATARNDGLVTREFYSLAIDPANHARTLGGQQDNGTSIRPAAGGSAWTDVVSADGGECGVDTGVPSFAIASTQLPWARLQRTSDVESPTSFNVVFPVLDYFEYGSFVAVFAQDTTTPGVAYTATSRVWKTTTFGDAWVPLPRTTTDGSTWYEGSFVYDVTVSRSNPLVLMAITSSNVFRSTDGGATWKAASTGLPGYSWNCVEIDPDDPNVAWLATSATNGTSIYYTSNGGTSWSPRSTGMPTFAALSVRVDPTDSSTVYAGTDSGLFRTTDNGTSWSRFGTGLPAASVTDIRISNDGSILRAATYGRGVWELDVTGNTNTLPSATISTPATNMVVAKGATLTFSGSVSDSDSGDSVTGRWTFGDTWETFTTPAGASSLAHTFNSVGTFQVGLVATDSHDARGSDTVKVTVTEPADSCATPIVIPVTSGFPISTTFDIEQATTTAGDPNPLSPSCANFTTWYTMWLELTPLESGSYDFSLCGTERGTGIVLYTGASCSSYTAIPNACLLNSNPKSDCATDSRLTVSLTAGVPIHILATPYLEAQGSKVTVTVSRTTPTVGITRVTPAAGPTSGGSSVVIYGSGFTAPTTITFGGTAATNVVLYEGKIITATVPAHAAGAVDVVVTSGGNSATLGGGYVYTSRALATPTNLIATRNGSSIALSWNGVTGADHYDILRRTTGAYATIASTSSTMFTDNSAITGTAYLYKVRAAGLGGEVSSDSNPDLATNVAFTDDPITAGTTMVRATHVNELRSAVNAVRTTAGLSAFSFTDTITAGTTVRAQHVLDLRTALDQARAALALGALSYAHAVSVGTVVRAVDFSELRDGVK